MQKENSKSLHSGKTADSIDCPLLSFGLHAQVTKLLLDLCAFFTILLSLLHDMVD